MHSDTAIKDIVFDLGLVLLAWNPRNLFVNHMSCAAEDVEHFLTNICTTPWHMRIDAGLAFDDAIAELLEHNPQYRDWILAYQADWPRMFAGQIDSTVGLLEQLHDAGYRLHALSNYPGQQIRFLYETYPFMQRFDTVLISGLLKVMKPDARIYRILLDTIGAKTCVFIDDREENVVAAQKLGIRTVHFTPEEGQNRLAQLVKQLCDARTAS